MGLDIIAIDGGDEKREMTKKLGAGKYVDFLTSKNLVGDVKAATADGLGPHAVILVAVNEKPFQQAAEVCSISRNEMKIVLIFTVRPSPWYRRRYRSARGCIPPRTRLRVRHQDDHHQGIVRWKQSRLS